MSASNNKFVINMKEIGVKTEDIDQVGDYCIIKVEKTELEIRASISQE
jgi:hypothetical protein